MTAEPFTDDVVAAIQRHMNDDHAEDSLLICRTLGGLAGASAAEMVGMDADGIDFTATVDGQPTAIRLPWSAPLTSRAQVRSEVVRMYHEACAVAGTAPRRSG